MSEFTNPAKGARDASDAYTQAVLSLLGDKDPLSTLRATPSTLVALAEGRSKDELTRPERPGKWSAAATAAHLADSELVWGYRLRTILADTSPSLHGYDQDSWAEALDYDSASFSEEAAAFRFLRERNLNLLSRLTPEQLQRSATHAERGPETVEHLIRLYAGHDLVHLNQIRRILAAR